MATGQEIQLHPETLPRFHSLWEGPVKSPSVAATSFVSLPPCPQKSPVLWKLLEGKNPKHLVFFQTRAPKDFDKIN